MQADVRSVCVATPSCSATGSSSPHLPCNQKVTEPRGLSDYRLWEGFAASVWHTAFIRCSHSVSSKLKPKFRFWIEVCFQKVSVWLGCCIITIGNSTSQEFTGRCRGHLNQIRYCTKLAGVFIHMNAWNW